MGYVLSNLALELFVSKWHRPNIEKENQCFTESRDEAMIFRTMPLANSYLKIYKLNEKGYQISFVNENPPPSNYKMPRKLSFTLANGKRTNY